MSTPHNYKTTHKVVHTTFKVTQKPGHIKLERKKTIGNEADSDDSLTKIGQGGYQKHKAMRHDHLRLSSQLNSQNMGNKHIKRKSNIENYFNKNESHIPKSSVQKARINQQHRHVSVTILKPNQNSFENHVIVMIVYRLTLHAQAQCSLMGTLLI